MYRCCQNCPQRNPGCHSACKRYLRQKYVHDLRTANIRKEREKEWALRKDYIKIHYPAGGTT